MIGLESGGMQPLPPGLRRTMERGFGADLSALRIDDSPAARGRTRRRGALAVARAERIDLGFPAALLGTRAGRRVLAHELAHVLQLRRGAAGQVPAPVAVLEAEACLAADRIGHEGKVDIVHAATPGSALAWGEVGHYYATYYVMLAAGMDPELAFRIAFFAQFPDEVEELDAVERGISWALGRLFGPLILTGGGMGGHPTMPSAEQTRIYMEQQKANEDQLHIQRGLHGLNGVNAEQETARRTAILEAIDPKGGDFAFEFGLAIHPFGDSFAHRKGDRMYHTGFGHAEDFHAPDIVSNERKALFVAYVDALYAIARKKANGAPRGLGAPSETLVRLTPMGSALNVPMPMQASYVRSWSSSLLGVPMKGYDPIRYDLVPFAEFLRKPHAITAGVRPDHLDKAVAFSRKWAG